MSRKTRHNEKVRARILVAAGEVFRAEGAERARIDMIMERAGLTRGGFYAHFPSKSALFAAAVAEEDLVLRLLRGRSAASPDALGQGLLYIFRRLLDPARPAGLAGAWTLPALMRDAALGDAAARAAHGRALGCTLEEMARGLRCGPGEPALAAALGLACGAHAMAAACPEEPVRAQLLAAARAEVERLLGAFVPKRRRGAQAGRHIGR